VPEELMMWYDMLLQMGVEEIGQFLVAQKLNSKDVLSIFSVLLDKNTLSAFGLSLGSLLAVRRLDGEVSIADRYSSFVESMAVRETEEKANKNTKSESSSTINLPKKREVNDSNGILPVVKKAKTTNERDSSSFEMATRTKSQVDLNTDEEKLQKQDKEDAIDNQKVSNVEDEKKKELPPMLANSKSSM